VKKDVDRSNMITNRCIKGRPVPLYFDADFDPIVGHPGLISAL